MNTRRLRNIIERHGDRGILAVAGYLWARRQWQHQHALSVVVLAVAFLAVGGMMWRLRSQQESPKPIRAAVPKITPLVAPIDPKELEAALQEAEALLADCHDVPPILPDPSFGSYELGEAKVAFYNILTDYGEITRAYLGVAQCEERMGCYERAAKTLNHVLKISPDNAAALDQLQKLRPLLDAKQILDKRIPAGQVITQMKRFVPQADQEFWAVLHGEAEISSDGWHDFKKMHLSVFAASPDFRQNGKTHRLIDDRFQGEFTYIDLFVFDMTHDGTPELVVTENFFGVSWAPSQLEIFAWRNGQPTAILKADGSEPLHLEDINQDGLYEVVNSFEIGQTMSHAAQVDWSDIYAYDGNCFVVANRRFPQRFASTPKELKAPLQEYPHDPEIEAYLCMAYSLLGRDKEARPFRKKAIAHFTHQWGKDEGRGRYQDQSYKNCLPTYLADIRRGSRKERNEQ